MTRGRWLLAAVVTVPAVIVAAHGIVRVTARIEPPRVDIAVPVVMTDRGVRSASRSSVRRVGRILEVRLRGSPEEMGVAHSRLLSPEMQETEGAVWKLFDAKVKNPLFRALLLDVGQWSYRSIASDFAPERARELAAQAKGLDPDPFADRFPTFQRYVYLTALYDISLAYEHSPLLGCTTVVFSGAHARGTPLLARAFDFDVDDVYDERKAVFLVSENGKIPFASVAWPGFVGVVSGMNGEGVAAVVHGARAGPIHTRGEPVAHEVRRLLSEARTTEDAIRLLALTDPLVSHVLVLQDAAGNAARVERIPGEASFVARLGERDAVTNHLDGPRRTDPKNQRVRETTSTEARKARADELVRAVDSADAETAVGILRDRKAAGGGDLPPGDRRALDAFIATHGVVMETASKRLWVSESPHLAGRFVAFDLPALFDPALRDEDNPPHAEIPPDSAPR